MNKVLGGVLLIAAMVGGTYLYVNYDVVVHRGQDGRVQSLTVGPRSDQPGKTPPAGITAKTPSPPIRVATFDLDGLGLQKLGSLPVGDVLIRLFSQYDLVAVQHVWDRNQRVLQELVEEINATGRQYDFVVAPAVERNIVHQYAAFLFDTTTIEVDRLTVAAVEDPEYRLRFEPLVALFRVKGPEPAEAFTFRLVNVHCDPDRLSAELDLLDDVYRAVRDSASGEDDVILLGSFGAGLDEMIQLAAMLDVTAAIEGMPTSLRDNRTHDNILFDRQATSEFTGRTGVVDVMREFELSHSEALDVSSHLPVWAEFSSYEGGQSGFVAERTP